MHSFQLRKEPLTPGRGVIKIGRMSLKKEVVMGDLKEVLEKLAGFDAGKLLALIDAFPDEKEGAEAVLRGEKRIVLEDVTRLLVDHTGRVIPAHLGITNAVCDENRNFYLRHRSGSIQLRRSLSARFKSFLSAGNDVCFRWRNLRSDPRPGE